MVVQARSLPYVEARVALFLLEVFVVQSRLS